MALAGYDADTAIAELPNVLNLAAAGNMDLARASDLVTDSQSALSLDLEKTEILMDQWAKAASKSNTSVEQLGEATLSVGGTAKDLNGGITELNTALGILADNGIKGSEGGIKLRNVILAMTPTTKNAKEAYEQLGISAHDADGNLRPLEDTFRDLVGALDGMSQKERSEILTKIFNKTDLKAVNALLAASGDEVSAISVALEDSSIEFEKYMDAVIARTGDANLTVTDFANDIADSIKVLTENGIDSAEQLQYLQEEFGLTAEDAAEAIKASSAVIGDEVSKISLALQKSEISWDDMVSKAQERLGDLSISTEDITDDIAGYISVIMQMGLSESEAISELADQIGVTEEQAAEFFEVATDAMNVNIDRWDELSAAIEDSEGAMAAMAAVQLDNLAGDITLFDSAMSGLKKTIGDAVTPALREFVQEGTVGIGQIKAAFSDGGWEAALSTVSSILGAMVTRFTEAIPKIVAVAQSMISQFLGAIQSNMPNLIAAADAILQGIVGAFNQLIPQLMNIVSQGIPTFINYFLTFKEQMFSIGLQLIVAIAQGIANNVPQIVQSAQDILSRFVSGIMQAIPQLLQAGTQILQSLSQGVAQSVPQFLSQALPMLVQFTGTLRQNAGQLIDAGLTLIKNLAQGIANAIPDLVRNIPTIVSNIAGIINDNAPKILQTGIEIIGTLIKGIIQAIPTIVANIPKIITAIVDVFTAFNWLNLGKQIIDFLANGIKSMISAAGGAARNIFDSIVNIINELPGKLLDLGKNGIQGLANGIKSYVSFVLNATKTIWSTIINTFTDLPSKLLEIGKNLISGLIQGIKDKASALWDTVSGLAGNVINKVKGIFGIHSPSKVFADIGKNLALGLGEGWSNNIDKVTDGIEDDLDFASPFGIGTYQTDANNITSKATGASNLTAGGKYSTIINININGANISDSREMAETISEKLQSLVERRQAVWA